jgi:hypothetical protein
VGSAEADLRDAEHEALAPPLLPAQLHDHGPLPLIGEAAPVVQRLAVGALLRLAPLEEPHTPFTGLEAIFVAEQVAVVPPLLPAQLHAHGPLPLTGDAAPAMQRLAVGALARLAPFEEPHAPFTASSSEHDTVRPPLLPTQVQLQGPLPVTAVAMPALQSPLVGAVLVMTPFAVPHNPSTRLGCFCVWAGPETMKERRKANTARRI